MWPFKSDLRTREAIGLSLFVLSIALTPVAWATSRLLWAVCGLLFLLGAALFYTQRMVDREIASAKDGGEAASRYTGPKMSGDVHNYSGWRSGGRSETMDADSGSADGD